MLAALPFQHGVIDRVSSKDIGQHQSSRPAANDCHLGSHRRFHEEDLPRARLNRKKWQGNFVPIEFIEQEFPI
jgi:hypothetical protein